MTKTKPALDVAYRTSAGIAAVVALYQHDNWDSDGAHAVDIKTATRAVELGLQLSSLGEPSVAAGFDGSLALLWESEKLYLYVDLLSADRVHYYYDPRNGDLKQQDVVDWRGFRAWLNQRFPSSPRYVRYDVPESSTTHRSVIGHQSRPHRQSIAR